MAYTNQPCHRCNGETEFLLLNNEQKCYSCNGARILTQQHAELFELGFAEEINLVGDYSMKYYRRDENGLIDVQVKRVGGNFVIANISLKSPTANKDMTDITDLEALVKFIREKT